MSPLAIGEIPEAFSALLSRGKSNGEPSYGALPVRHFGVLHHLVVGFVEWLGFLRMVDAELTRALQIKR